jgi:hypothetical protein
MAALSKRISQKKEEQYFLQRQVQHKMEALLFMPVCLRNIVLTYCELRLEEKITKWFCSGERAGPFFVREVQGLRGSGGSQQIPCRLTFKMHELGMIHLYLNSYIFLTRLEMREFLDVLKGTRCNNFGETEALNEALAKESPYDFCLHT